jgi:hypothetical protein
MVEIQVCDDDDVNILHGASDTVERPLERNRVFLGGRNAGRGPERPFAGVYQNGLVPTLTEQNVGWK